ncbi:unknown protein [Seminavis robusta]|uniref:Uncharacterized protein n=1 Tax=Seminavis robusta TaxID=568900 RepID=A0A9N8I052_9STRA|nr:unknown protein [Seminavis robusta]|eukprot:Sro3440_g348070.1 n/a (128) ;mRNA; r:1202-1585
MEKGKSTDHTAATGNSEEDDQSQSQNDNEKLSDDLFNSREELEEAQLKASFKPTAENKSKSSSDGSAEAIGTDTLDTTQTIEIGVANIHPRQIPAWSLPTTALWCGRSGSTSSSNQQGGGNHPSCNP